MMNWICNTAVTGKEALGYMATGEEIVQQLGDCSCCSVVQITNKTVWWRWVPEVQLGEIESTSQRNDLITIPAEQVQYGQSTRPLFSRTGVARVRLFLRYVLNYLDTKTNGIYRL